MPIKPQERITREIIQIAATMQAKALAFDSEHPDNALGTCSASTYARAIRALLPETEELAVGTLMLEAGAEAMGLLLLARANTELPTSARSASPPAARYSRSRGWGRELGLLTLAYSAIRV